MYGIKKITGFILLVLFILPGFLKSQNIKPEMTEQNIIPAADPVDRNNNFYDNTDTYQLQGGIIEISGEIENPGIVDFSKLPRHSVIVKETLLKDDGTDAFTGAYRYDGYSLFDILNERIIKKKNTTEFKPIIDLYVEIENSDGDKVVLSWGEIYYTNFLHNSIIATGVSRIVPSKTKELWPLPVTRKLVIATDLVTERNISNPIKITVGSYPRSVPVNRDLDPLYSAEFKITAGEKELDVIRDNPKLQLETVHTIFYGRGRGIHSTQPFTGFYLKELLGKYFQMDRKNLRNGILAIVGKDGYRSVYSYSEIMNRNDQAEILLVPCKDEKDGGQFRIFPSCDFFSDRAVKAVSEIRFELADE